MDMMTTVLVVHETTAPDRRGLVSLCGDHAALLREGTWVEVDEVVGFSAAVHCEACALMRSPASEGPFLARSSATAQGS